MSKWTSTDQLRFDGVHEALLAFRKYHLRWSKSLRRLSPFVIFGIPRALDQAAEKLSARERMAISLGDHTAAFTIVDAEVSARFIFGRAKQCYVESKSRPRYHAIATVRAAYHALGADCPWLLVDSASLEELREIPAALAAMPPLSLRQQHALRNGRAKIIWVNHSGRLVAVFDDEKQSSLFDLFNEESAS